MVAITYRLKHTALFIAYLLLTTLCPVGSLSASTTGAGRITALEGDTTYMYLISKRENIINRDDSLSKLLLQYREEFAAGGAQASKARTEIVNIELELFDLRSESNSINDKIVTIEQKWISSNSVSDEAIEVDRSNGTSSSGDNSKSIAKSKVAKDNLPVEDYNNLLNAELVEAKCLTTYEEYMATYEKMQELLQLYNQTDDQDEANGYRDQFYDMSRSADSLSNIAQNSWERAYDNKDFAYKMLMELMGYNDLLNLSEEMSRESESQITASECGATSEPLARYYFQKQNILNLERLFAEKLQLQSAVDSLNVATKQLSQVSKFEGMPDLIFIKRNFILYEPILFSSTPTYDASNPIPEMVSYPKGRIYRIQYGAFNAKQLPSIFHGAYPLSYEKLSGLWTYYGGGYSSFVEAEEAAALCKRKGFKRPEVVMWQDGVRRNLSREPLPMDTKYRVQISGVEEMPDEIKSVIAIHCPEAELSKVGAKNYVIGPLTGELKANEFTDAIKDINRVITTNIIKIE